MELNINIAQLRERIALCADFSPAERHLLLVSLALDDYSGEHVYPPSYPKDTTIPSVRAAWAVLDQLPPDAMKTVHRFMLAGLIAGAYDALCQGR